MNVTKNEALIEARIRQANADAALKELRYKEKSGELVNREKILKEIAEERKEEALRIRTKILSIEELPPQLQGLDMAEMAKILRRKAIDILNELAAQSK